GAAGLAPGYELPADLGFGAVRPRAREAGRRRPDGRRRFRKGALGLSRGAGAASPRLVGRQLAGRGPVGGRAARVLGRGWQPDPDGAAAGRHAGDRRRVRSRGQVVCGDRNHPPRAEQGSPHPPRGGPGTAPITADRPGRLHGRDVVTRWPLAPHRLAQSRRLVVPEPGASWPHQDRRPDLTPVQPGNDRARGLPEAGRLVLHAGGHGLAVATQDSFRGHTGTEELALSWETDASDDFGRV